VVELMVFFIIIISLIALIGLGIFLLTYKRKGQPRVYPKWFHTLSPEAQQVHLKEWQKKTASMFTRHWFMEYWKGERSAFSAWFTWVFVGKLIVVISLLIMISMHSVIAGYFLVSYGILLILYSIMSSIILWKCAKNSTTGYKYFARFVAIISLVSLGRTYLA